MGLFGKIASVVAAPVTSGASLLGLNSGVQKGFGQVTGFGGQGGIDPKTVDPEAYKELYEAALKDLEGVGTSDANKNLRSGIEQAAISQLQELGNNSALRKKYFQEDMSRGFGADMQNLAKARGGTGTLAQVLQPSSSSIDAQARARARGLLDINDKAVSDLGNLQGLQGNLYNQDLNKMGDIANMKMRELASRRGQVAENKDREYNANTERYNRQMGTIKTAMEGAAMASGKKG